MEEVKRIYKLLSHNNGLNIRDVAKELDLDKYFVAEVMFSTENIPYWYQDDSALWFAKEGVIQIDEPIEDKLETPLNTPRNINVERYLQGHPSDSLRLYIKRLPNYRVFSDDEIKELLERYRNGDFKAYDLIVKSYQRLVVGLAFLYSKNGVPLEDLIQEGNLGLLRAIKYFDFSKSRSFHNYAKRWILQAISLSITHLPYIIRLPISQLALYRKVKMFKEKFEQENEIQPSVNLIEIDDNIDFERIAFLNNLPYDLKDWAVHFDDMDSFESDYNQIDNFENKEYNRYNVNRLLNLLDGRIEVIVRLSYGIGVNPESRDNICKFYDLTFERVRQLLNQAIKRMRNKTEIDEDNDETKKIIKSKRVVKILGVATIGDYVEVPLTSQIGKFINIHKSIEGDTIYVLRTDEGNIINVSKSDRLVSSVNKNIKDITSDRETLLKEININKSIKHETKQKNYYRNSNVLSSKQETAKIGDRILYDSKSCTVIGKRTMGGFSRLIVKYDDGNIDNLSNDKNRYVVI